VHQEKLKRGDIAGCRKVDNSNGVCKSTYDDGGTGLVGAEGEKIDADANTVDEEAINEERGRWRGFSSGTMLAMLIVHNGISLSVRLNHY